ncbi:MAG: EutP/PduV family microcompartment system protein [Bacillota bacterium]|jgi:ethanolamine utilization protein EutP
MSKARVMLVGAVGSGKTTLVRALHGNCDSVTKTQAMEYTANSIDTPGEFIENPFFYRALFATSLEAEVIIFIQDATREKSVFPPGFAGAFSKRTIGVVTKVDHPTANVERASRFLKGLGLSGPVTNVSAITGEGLDELKKVINWA